MADEEQLRMHDFLSYFSRTRTTKISQPRLVSCWTRLTLEQGGDVLIGSRDGLRPLRVPSKLPLSLAEGYPGNYVRKEDSRPSIKPILDALGQAGAQLRPQGPPGEDLSKGGAGKVVVSGQKVDVVSFRNNLNKIANTLIDPRGKWIIDACLDAGVLFLDIVSTPGSEYAGRDRYSYYGYKFEALCMGAGLADVVDTTGEWVAVTATRLTDLDIVIAAEIDGFDPTLSNRGPEESAPKRDVGSTEDGEDPIGPPKKKSRRDEDRAAEGTEMPSAQWLVEVKTTRHIRSSHQYNILYNVKYARWWFQSYIAGVPRLVVGQWDEHGLIRDVQEKLLTSSLPHTAQRNGATWRPAEMLQWCHHVLSWMRRRCAVIQDRQDCQGREQKKAVVRFSNPGGCSSVQDVVLSSHVLSDSDLPQLLCECPWLS